MEDRNNSKILNLTQILKKKIKKEKIRQTMFYLSLLPTQYWLRYRRKSSIAGCGIRYTKFSKFKTCFMQNFKSFIYYSFLPNERMHAYVHIKLLIDICKYKNVLYKIIFFTAIEFYKARPVIHENIR